MERKKQEELSTHIHSSDLAFKAWQGTRPAQTLKTILQSLKKKQDTSDWKCEIAKLISKGDNTASILM